MADSMSAGELLARLAVIAGAPVTEEHCTLAREVIEEQKPRLPVGVYNLLDYAVKVTGVYALAIEAAPARLAVSA